MALAFVRRFPEVSMVLLDVLIFQLLRIEVIPLNIDNWEKTLRSLPPLLPSRDFQIAFLVTQRQICTQVMGLIISLIYSRGEICSAYSRNVFTVNITWLKWNVKRFRNGVRRGKRHYSHASDLWATESTICFFFSDDIFFTNVPTSNGETHETWHWQNNFLGRACHCRRITLDYECLDAWNMLRGPCMPRHLKRSLRLAHSCLRTCAIEPVARAYFGAVRRKKAYLNLPDCCCCCFYSSWFRCSRLWVLGVREECSAFTVQRPGTQTSRTYSSDSYLSPRG